MLSVRKHSGVAVDTRPSRIKHGTLRELARRIVVVQPLRREKQNTACVVVVLFLGAVEHFPDKEIEIIIRV